MRVDPAGILPLALCRRKMLEETQLKDTSSGSMPGYSCDKHTCHRNRSRWKDVLATWESSLGQSKRYSRRNGQHGLLAQGHLHDTFIPSYKMVNIWTFDAFSVPVPRWRTWIGSEYKGKNMGRHKLPLMTWPVPISTLKIPRPGDLELSNLHMWLGFVLLVITGWWPEGWGAHCFPWKPLLDFLASYSQPV